MFLRRCDRQRTLAIRIAAITLASDSAITIARFCPVLKAHETHRFVIAFQPPPWATEDSSKKSPNRGYEGSHFCIDSSGNMSGIEWRGLLPVLISFRLSLSAWLHFCISMCLLAGSSIHLLVLCVLVPLSAASLHCLCACYPDRSV